MKRILILHAPTFIHMTSALGFYSNAMAITGTSSAMVTPLDAAGLAQLISKHQKELSAMNKKNDVSRPGSAPKPAGQKYCYIHGYQKSHTGADCNVLKANAQQQLVHSAVSRCHGLPSPRWWKSQRPRLTVRSKCSRRQDQKYKVR